MDMHFHRSYDSLFLYYSLKIIKYYIIIKIQNIYLNIIVKRFMQNLNFV